MHTSACDWIGRDAVGSRVCWLYGLGLGQPTWREGEVQLVRREHWSVELTIFKKGMLRRAFAAEGANGSLAAPMLS